jgi:hypothetical protein
MAFPEPQSDPSFVAWGQAAAYGPQTVIPVKPAGDGIAAKAHDATAGAMHVGNQGIVDQVQLLG